MAIENDKKNISQFELEEMLWAKKLGNRIGLAAVIIFFAYIVFKMVSFPFYAKREELLPPVFSFIPILYIGFRYGGKIGKAWFEFKGVPILAGVYFAFILNTATSLSLGIGLYIQNGFKSNYPMEIILSIISSFAILIIPALILGAIFSISFYQIKKKACIVMIS